MCPSPSKQIYHAIRDDDLDLVEKLLNDNPDLVRAKGDYGDYPTVLVPLWKRDPPAGCDESCEYETAKANGPNASGFVGRCNGPMLDLLLGRGVELDPGFACLTGRLDFLEKRLADDPDLVHRPTPWAGDSLLQWAAWGNQPEVIDALVARGASTHVTAKDGQTPMHKAAHFGCDAAVAALLRHGADMYVEEPSARATPLVWAILRGHSHTARLFVREGYDVNEDAYWEPDE